MNKYWVYIIFCALSHSLFGQNNNPDLYDHRLNEKKWDKLRDGVRYEGYKDGVGREWTYESKKEYNKAQEKKGKKNSSGTNSGGGSGNSSSGTGNSNSKSGTPYVQPRKIVSHSFFNGMGFLGYVLLIVFIILLGFLIYYLYLNTPRDGKKIIPTEDLDEINPTEVSLTELQRLLQEAISRGDYRGAVRIYFIFIIRDLAEKNQIRWQKEKTNFDYLREMSGKNEFDDFNRSVSFFEIIWYGKRELDARKFEEIRPNFTNFLNKLGVK